MNSKCYSCIILIITLLSCKGRCLEDEVELMLSQPVLMSSCKASTCYKNGRITEKYVETPCYKLIISIDSLSCSPCFISHMENYANTVEMFKRVGIETFFILEPPKELLDETISTIKEYPNDFLTIVVKGGHFSRDNPYIPNDRLLRGFLVDNRNQIVVVGDPARNANIRRLMLKTLRNEKNKS